jgi:hypothetical protein
MNRPKMLKTYYKQLTNQPTIWLVGQLVLRVPVLLL